MTAVLVTDGDERASLAVARSLGRAGHRVVVASTSGRSLAGASRFAVEDRQVPDPAASPGAYGEALLALAARHEIDVLIPVTEAALLSVLHRKAEFDPVRIPFPDLETFRAVSDKERVSRVARGLGLGDPTLARAADRDELRARADVVAEGTAAVLKPVRSVVDAGGRRRKTAVRHVSGADEIRTLAAGMDESTFPVLIQRRIDGPGIGVFLLLWNDRLLAIFGHRRIREKPPSGGVSVLRESAALEPSLSRASADLLREFGWRGVAMVEFKVEDASGTPYLMEVNGRFWGSLQLAIDAGVDFPRILVRAACGEEVDPADEYRVGVRTRWFWGDVDHLIARLIRSKSALRLGPSAPGRGAVVLDFVRAFGPSVRTEVFRLDDPLPALRESVGWLRTASR